MNLSKISENNQEYLHQVKQRVRGKGGFPGSNELVIEHMLNELRLFEHAAGMTITEWIKIYHSEALEDFE